MMMMVIPNNYDNIWCDDDTLEWWQRAVLMIHCNRQHLPLRLLHLSPDYDDVDDDDNDDDGDDNNDNDDDDDDNGDDDDDEFGESDDPL